MSTDLDTELGPLITELLEEFGVPVVYRRVLGTYQPAVSAVCSFYSAAITASTTDDSFNWPAGDFVAAGVTASAWILVSGFAASANNGWAKVVSVTAEKVVVSKNLTTEALGKTIKISLATDYATFGFVSEWDKRYWNGADILPTDGMVITDLQPMLPAEPIPNSLFFDGEDPATASQYTVTALRKVRTGALAPLGMVGIRA